MDNPFYKEVERVVDSIALGQILKGAEKYPEPFNPDSWTNEELLTHNLQELRDAQVYSVAMLDRMRKQQEHLKMINGKLERYMQDNTKLRNENSELKKQLADSNQWLVDLINEDDVVSVQRAKEMMAHGISD